MPCPATSASVAMVVTGSRNAGRSDWGCRSEFPISRHPDGLRTRGERYHQCRAFIDETTRFGRKPPQVRSAAAGSRGRELHAAKPDEEVDVEYEAEMVQKHLFLYNEDLLVAAAILAETQPVSDANARMIEMPTPSVLGLPMY